MFKKRLKLANLLHYGGEDVMKNVRGSQKNDKIRSTWRCTWWLKIQDERKIQLFRWSTCWKLFEGDENRRKINFPATARVEECTTTMKIDEKPISLWFHVLINFLDSPKLTEIPILLGDARVGGSFGNCICSCHTVFLSWNETKIKQLPPVMPQIIIKGNSSHL